MATVNQIATLAAAVTRLTMDRTNRTTGPGHYTASTLNALADALRRERGIKFGRVEYPDYVKLPDSYF